MSGISSVLEIVKDSRLMHLKSENGWANTDKISWPKFDANINIVLTHKALQKNSDIELLDPRGDLKVSNYIGRTLGSLGLKYMSAVLLINTANSESTPTTTAHEIGHAIGLKTEGENFDGYLHCKSSDCLMFQASKTLMETITTTSKLFGLYRKTVRSIESVDNGHTFCDECTHQLGKYLCFLKEHKNGKTLAPYSLGLGKPIKDM